jgi:hypothetical protein|tara:strand:+ start:44 stop:292 length:249 start_codon:yes stop_codon:yes gene_type:complete
MSKRNTPVALLIDAMQDELENSPKEVWQGMEYAIAIAKTFLPEEKKIMCKFANDWADAREESERQRKIEEDEFKNHLGKFKL